MRKLIASAVLAATCSISASTLAAVPEVSPAEVAEFEKFPTQFKNQTQCLQGMHFMRSAYIAAVNMPRDGYVYLASLGYSVPYIQEQLISLMPDVFSQYGVKMRSLGITIVDYLSYMALFSRISQVNDSVELAQSLFKPDYQPRGYMGLFEDQFTKCYTHFKEFEQDPEMEFEIFDSMALPQDVGWDSFDLNMSDYQGNKVKLDFNGKPIK